MAHETEQDTMEKEVEEPELTLRSGLAVAGAALAYFVTVGYLNAYGVFQEYYTSVYLSDLSNFQISWLGSFATFMIFICAPAAGILSDKIGPTIPIAMGSVCMLVAVFMVSLCTEYYQFFLAQGVLQGFGMSFVAIPAAGMVPKYFTRNRGLATGISVGGSSLGGVIWPIVMDELLHHDGVSFPWAIRIGGFIMLPLCTLVILTVRSPLKAKISDHGESGKAAEKDSRDAAPEANDEKRTTVEKKDLSVLRKPPFIFLSLGFFFAIFGFFVPVFFVSTYATSIGISSSLAFYLVSIFNAASLFGRILPGIVSDKLGGFNMMIVICFFAGIIAFTWTTATSVAGLVIWTMTFGFVSGAILSLQLSCATKLAKPENAGAVVGAIMGATSLATLFGAPIAGELVKYGYIAPACWSGACLLLGCVFVTLSRLSVDRKLRAKV